MELKDLVGRHWLSGVDFETEKDTGYDKNDAQVINFILDGETYTATEDPSDGYRSCLSDIYKSRKRIKNSFYSIEVIGSMDDEIIEFKAIQNEKIVLSVGTANSDDYYPSFVANFIPENIPPFVAKRRGRYLRPKGVKGGKT